MKTIIGFMIPIKNSSNYKLVYQKSDKQIIHYQFFKELKEKIKKLSNLDIEKYTQIPRCRFEYKSMTLYIPDNFELDNMATSYIIFEFGLIEKFDEIKIKKTIAERLDNKFNLQSYPNFVS